MKNKERINLNQFILNVLEEAFRFEFGGDRRENLDFTDVKVPQNPDNEISEELKGESGDASLQSVGNDGIIIGDISRLSIERALFGPLGASAKEVKEKNDGGHIHLPLNYNCAIATILSYFANCLNAVPRVITTDVCNYKSQNASALAKRLKRMQNWQTKIDEFYDFIGDYLAPAGSNTQVTPAVLKKFMKTCVTDRTHKEETLRLFNFMRGGLKLGNQMDHGDWLQMYAYDRIPLRKIAADKRWKEKWSDSPVLKNCVYYDSASGTERFNSANFASLFVDIVADGNKYAKKKKNVINRDIAIKQLINKYIKGGMKRADATNQAYADWQAYELSQSVGPRLLWESTEVNDGDDEYPDDKPLDDVEDMEIDDEVDGNSDVETDASSQQQSMVATATQTQSTTPGIGTTPVPTEAPAEEVTKQSEQSYNFDVGVYGELQYCQNLLNLIINELHLSPAQFYWTFSASVGLNQIINDDDFEDMLRTAYSRSKDPNATTNLQAIQKNTIAIQNALINCTISKSGAPAKSFADISKFIKEKFDEIFTKNLKLYTANMYDEAGIPDADLKITRAQNSTIIQQNNSFQFIEHRLKRYFKKLHSYIRKHKQNSKKRETGGIGGIETMDAIFKQWLSDASDISDTTAYRFVKAYRDPDDPSNAILTLNDFTSEEFPNIRAFFKRLCSKEAIEIIFKNIHAAQKKEAKEKEEKAALADGEIEEKLKAIEAKGESIDAQQQVEFVELLMTAGDAPNDPETIGKKTHIFKQSVKSKNAHITRCFQKMYPDDVIKKNNFNWNVEKKLSALISVLDAAFTDRNVASSVISLLKYNSEAQRYFVRMRKEAQNLIPTFRGLLKNLQEIRASANVPTDKRDFKNVSSDMEVISAVDLAKTYCDDVFTYVVKLFPERANRRNG